MASSNTALKVTELDFASIKNNLKTFLKSQSEFTDYDFEGSGMSVLLDVLAYNTYYNAFYLNMAANESFLDSAQIRKNIISLAKQINYFPKSKQASTALVNITFTPGTSTNPSVNVATIPRFTRLVSFGGSEGTNYEFVTVDTRTTSKANGVFFFPNVMVKQGEAMTHQYEMTSNNIYRTFSIPSQNVDTDTIIVSVQESSSNTYRTEYFLADDLTEVKANSEVFFLEENENLNYKIQFGDNVIGKRPANGNIVIISYVDTSGAVANNISDFTIGTVPNEILGSISSVQSVRASSGGTDKETEEQIKFRAPYAYTAQNRAVTKNDYEALILRDFSDIDAVSVWGGEENDPVVYGKVFISLKTKNYYALTELQKKEIKDELIGKRNIMTVIPEIINPEFIYILVSGKVSYNINRTSKSQQELLTSIRNAIITYAQTELNTFRSTFRKSKLQQYIEAADQSITGSDLTIYLQNQLDIYPEETRNYYINFNAPLTKGSITDRLYTFPETTVLDLEGIQRKVLFEEVQGSLTGVASIVITDRGSDYTSTPTVTITGDGNSANAYAKIVNGKVTEIVVDKKGFEYSRATVSITGGGGIGAAAYALIENNFAFLRSYYYKDNGEKVIVDAESGTVNYDQGKIVLDSLYALNTIPNAYYANNVLSFNAVPSDEIITPLRNRILTLDPNDGKSIVIELVEET